MTNEQARRIGEELLMRAMVGGEEADLKETDYKDFLVKAIDALEAAEQYGWHDLKKNPDDLPKEGKVLIFAKRWSGVVDKYVKDVWITLYLDEIGFDVNKATHPTKVLAWKYIEPFEEVQK